MQCASSVPTALYSTSERAEPPSLLSSALWLHYTSPILVSQAPVHVAAPYEPLRNLSAWPVTPEFS